MRHLRENFLTHAVKYGLKRHATKDLLKEMFNSIVYAPFATEYGLAMKEMKKLRHELVKWVEGNELEHWSLSKFKKEM